jgi:hypothetical protein
MILSCSMVEPGHPWVTMSGSASSCFGAHVDEVDVHPVDLGDEVRQGGEALLELAPVVIRWPNRRLVPGSSPAAPLARHPSPGRASA